jgi:hypothetical protein
MAEKPPLNQSAQIRSITEQLGKDEPSATSLRSLNQSTKAEVLEDLLAVIPTTRLLSS